MSDAMWRQARDKAYLGQGLAWPLQVDSRGGLALAHGERDLEQAIQIILETAPGERVMRPEFGCRIHDLVFAPHDAATEGLVIRYVEEALERWEPRVAVQQVNISTDPTRDGVLLIEIRYQVKDSHDERSIVHPFYLTGEEEPI
ncbi:MAG TPA: GPW/gp25 family protein [Anaerolineae bacterium]|nr:GPW/gp25 family protein [Anaerolineae bacterium]